MCAHVLDVCFKYKKHYEGLLTISNRFLSVHDGNDSHFFLYLYAGTIK